LEEKLAKDWKVVRMEQTSNNYAPQRLDISPNMAFNFLPNYKAEMITQLGSTLKGEWSLKDSTLMIKVKGENKTLKIQRLTAHQLVLTSGKFKIHAIH
jgi:hypothetical protein